MTKTVVITGASKGIGASTSKVFAKAGYDVAISYFHSPEAVAQVVKACEDHGVKALAVQADCSKEEGIQKLADKVAKIFGKVDVLINNFGVAREPDFETISQAEIIEVLNNILISTFISTRIFVPKLMQETSSVLNLSSIYGLDQGGKISMPLYSASKAAIINFTQVMAQKYAPSIRFNAVAPGFTRTPHWEEVSPKYTKACLDTNLQKEFVQPEEIAEALLFLVKTPHVNAETLVIDAGRSKK